MKILVVERCVPDVQRYIREIPFRKPQYMIHSIVNGDCSPIQMAYKKLLVLENEHYLPHSFLAKRLNKKECKPKYTTKRTSKTKIKEESSDDIPININ